MAAWPERNGRFGELGKLKIEKVKIEKELNELISELYIKLKQAANFYYKLEEKHPELTDFTDE